MWIGRRHSSQPTQPGSDGSQEEMAHRKLQFTERFIGRDTLSNGVTVYKS